MSTTTILELPTDLLDAAQITPAELKRDLAGHLYQQHRLSLEQAAELAGLSAQEIAVFTPPHNGHPTNGHKSAPSPPRLDRRDFDVLAILSHELRTPLNAIHGYASLLLQDAPTLGESHQGWVKHITQNSHRLLSLWQDLFNFTRLQSGDLDLYRQPVDLWEILADAPLSSPYKPITFEWHIPDDLPWVCADERWLGEILGNLLDSAEYYTDEGRITIEAAADGERVTLVITDPGVGLPSHVLENLATPEPTWWAPGTPEWKLVFSNYLIAQHGGTLRAENLAEGGTRVTLTLPVAGED